MNTLSATYNKSQNKSKDYEQWYKSIMIMGTTSRFIRMILSGEFIMMGLMGLESLEYQNGISIEDVKKRIVSFCLFVTISGQKNDKMGRTGGPLLGRSFIFCITDR